MIKGGSETIKNEEKEQNDGFASMLLDTSAASLLGVIGAGEAVILYGKGTEGSSQDF